MRMKALILLGAACLTGAATPPAGRPLDEPVSLCKMGELVLANAVFGAKQASVCLDYGGKQRGFGTASYRFGTAKAIEVELHGVQAASIAYAGGGEDQIIVAKDSYRYVLYQNMIAGDWDRQGHRAHTFHCGLIVACGDKVLAEHSCTPRAATIIASGLAYDLLPRGQAFEH